MNTTAVDVRSGVPTTYQPSSNRAATAANGASQTASAAVSTSRYDQAYTFTYTGPAVPPLEFPEDMSVRDIVTTLQQRIADIAKREDLSFDDRAAQIETVRNQITVWTIGPDRQRIRERLEAWQQIEQERRDAIDTRTPPAALVSEAKAILDRSRSLGWSGVDPELRDREQKKITNELEVRSRADLNFARAVVLAQKQQEQEKAKVDSYEENLSLSGGQFAKPVPDDFVNASELTPERKSIIDKFKQMLGDTLRYAGDFNKITAKRADLEFQREYAKVYGEARLKSALGSDLELAKDERFAIGGATVLAGLAGLPVTDLIAKRDDGTFVLKDFTFTSGDETVSFFNNWTMATFTGKDGNSQTVSTIGISTSQLDWLRKMHTAAADYPQPDASKATRRLDDYVTPPPPGMSPEDIAATQKRIAEREIQNAKAEKIGAFWREQPMFASIVKDGKVIAKIELNGFVTTFNDEADAAAMRLFHGEDGVEGPIERALALAEATGGTLMLGDAEKALKEQAWYDAAERAMAIMKAIKERIAAEAERLEKGEDAKGPAQSPDTVLNLDPKLERRLEELFRTPLHQLENGESRETQAMRLIMEHEFLTRIRAVPDWAMNDMLTGTRDRLEAEWAEA